MVKPGSESGGLTEVAAKLDDENAGVDGGDLFKQPVGTVPGAVVDEDEFKGFANLLHHGLEAVVRAR